MNSKSIKLTLITLFLFASLTACLNSGKISENKLSAMSEGSIVVPKTWDDTELASLELPLANTNIKPVYVPSSYYYQIPVQEIYKSYPVYAPGKEPAGYLDWLKQQQPEVIFDAGKLKSQEDWIKAGEIVFEAPTIYGFTNNVDDVRNPEWYSKTGVPVTKDGVMPYYRYVIKEKGKIELGNLSCANCHTRVMPDGSIIKGAQGNFPFDRAQAFTFSRIPDKALHNGLQGLFGSPWIKDDLHGKLQQMSIEDITTLINSIPPGVLARQGSSPFYPPQVPSLIGVKDIKYLDHTGLVRHRSPGDFMRYAALNQGLDFTIKYNDFIPDGEISPPSTQTRYSDEQLYALTLYIYSLQPPPNPNKFDTTAAQGEKIFQREGCIICHTPPLYTNNKLTPADGFNIPDSHLKEFDILSIYIGTDPNLTTKTRRGTGYYKVPSLRGVWYRSPFGHNGSVLTLEDWFDPRRTKDDYAPTGFIGTGLKTQAVKGHNFGLNLTETERKTLIAFLKTL